MQIFEWLNTDLFRIIGWSIIHSLWQSFILLGALKIILLFVTKRKSRLRYMISVSILFGMLLCTVFTIQYVREQFAGNVVQLNSNPPVTDNNASPVQAPGAQAGIAPATASQLNFLDRLTTISPYLTIGWIIGLLLYAAKLVHSCLYLNSLRKLPGEPFQDVYSKLNELTGKMGIKKNIRLIISSKVSEPLTFGFIKPVILLPFSYAMQVPMDQVEMILAHELSHIKRGDYLINLLQSTFEAIFFFNPFFYSISNIVRTEREYCCDDMAATVCGNEQKMAIALANLKLLSGYPGLALSAAPVKSAFHQRIYRLINPGAKFKLTLKIPFFTFLLLISFLLFLTKCVNDLNNSDILPQQADSLQQLYTDNQADHKIQVFNYSKDNQSHDLLLVSTTGGDPLYAYLDGNSLSGEQLDRIHKLLNEKRTISPEKLRNRQLSPQELRNNRSQQLNREIDSIDLVIKNIEASLHTAYSASLQMSLDASKKELSARTDETKTLAMEGYNDAVKNIAVDVKLSELLTRIIRSKVYTAEARKELNELLKKRK